MKALILRAKTFVSGATASSGTQTLTKSPEPRPQSLPDWVMDTNTYKLGVKDGSIVPVVIPDEQAVLVPNAVKELEPEPEEPAEESGITESALKPDTSLLDPTDQPALRRGKTKK